MTTGLTAGEHGRRAVNGSGDGLGVDAIVDLLAGGAHSARAPEPPSRSSTTPCRRRRCSSVSDPDDLELAVAGLVHDIGHLMPGVRDEAHPDAPGRRPCGRRSGSGSPAWSPCTWRPSGTSWPPSRGYASWLAADSVASLAAQGGAMSPAEAAAFETLPLAPAAVRLRRADEGAKGEAVVRDLGSWVTVLRGLSERGATRRLQCSAIIRRRTPGGCAGDERETRCMRGAPAARTGSRATSATPGRVVMQARREAPQRSLCSRYPWGGPSW